MQRPLLRKAIPALSLIVVGLSLEACSLFSVYKIDIPQGSPLTQSQIAQVKVGMTQQQVRFLLGTPSITDTLNPNRWDYVYSYIPGTLARSANLKPASGEHLVILFSDSGTVTSITGADTFPVNQPGLPLSKDPQLTAAPL